MSLGSLGWGFEFPSPLPFPVRFLSFLLVTQDVSSQLVLLPGLPGTMDSNSLER